LTSTPLLPRVSSSPQRGRAGFSAKFTGMIFDGRWRIMGAVEIIYQKGQGWI